ncbi:hypothetical protein [Actibacterium ureilyticum]|nr:hypothetical protein [Actibacterium ureilyticum]
MIQIVLPFSRPGAAPRKPLPPVKLKPSTGRTAASRRLRSARVKPERKPT